MHIKRTFRHFTIALAGTLLAALMTLDADAQDKAAPADKGTAAADKTGTPAKGAARPALTVTLVAPRSAEVPVTLPANGSIAAWQEAILGAEVNGLKLSEVHAQVGDVVRRGQLLARFAAETVEAELEQAKAAVAEAEATLAEARANAERAQSVAGSGALSAQQVAQYQTAEKTAAARLAQALAQRQAQTLRVSYARVTAPDDGVIAARNATVGAVVPQGQELFRLIRKSRLEWRAEVTAAELPRLKAGAAATLSAPGLPALEGRVRVVAPTLDPATRNALVYVELPEAMGKGYKPGMFARGEFRLGSSGALLVPQDAVLLSDGFAWVFRAGAVEGDRTRVARVKVGLGRRAGSDMEITSGLKAGERIAAGGVAFLADGDLVKVAR